MSGRTLHISVIDDGAGLAPQSAPNGAGLGLGALRERLALIFPASALVLESGREGGCAVHVRIPV